MLQTPEENAREMQRDQTTRQTGYLDGKYDTSGDPLLPDLGNAAAQDDALGMLVSLQDGADPAQARMLAAIHNLLYDQWSEKGSTP